MTRLINLIIIIILLSTPVCAQEEQSTAGLITGKVVNESGQPLAGAAVFVRPMHAGNAFRNTTSDAEGNFRVNNLNPGLYTITANAPAYTVENPSGPTYYRVGDYARLQLVRGGVITGTVTNALGEPVVGVRVRAARVRDAKGQVSKLPTYAFSNLPTDDRGVYRMYGIAPGTYVVSAGGGAGFSSLFNPYEGDIPTYSPSSPRDTAAEITLRGGDEMTADIRYRGEQGYSISGTAKASGNSGVTLMLAPVNGSAPMQSTFQPAGALGFAFNGLPDGEYNVAAQEAIQAPGLAMPFMAVSDVKRVTVKGASVAGVELVTRPLGSISGRITLEPSKIPECEGKRPPLFAETIVTAQRHEKDTEADNPIYRQASGGIAGADANGAFVLRNLRAGRYRLDPRLYARYWYLRSITMNTAGPKSPRTDLVAHPPALKHGEQLNNITITLAEGAASMRGRVALAEATAVPVNTVYLVPIEPAKAEDVLRYFVADIGADGAFAFNSVPPGKYLIAAQVNSDAQLATTAKLRYAEAAAARAKLRRAAESQKTEIELKPCQNLANYQLKG